jgi:predicted DNA-binding transcriptional regulator AlpA
MSTPHFPTIGDFLRWLRTAPAGTTLPASEVCSLLTPLAESRPEPEPVAPSVDIEPSWRERLWLCPAETRFGIADLCEALGKPKSWVYRHTSEKSGLPRLPHRKLDGMLLFVAGEVRTWLRENEDTVHEMPMESTPAERGGLRALGPNKAA